MENSPQKVLESVLSHLTLEGKPVTLEAGDRISFRKGDKALLFFKEGSARPILFEGRDDKCLLSSLGLTEWQVLRYLRKMLNLRVERWSWERERPNPLYSTFVLIAL